MLPGHRRHRQRPGGRAAGPAPRPASPTTCSDEPLQAVLPSLEGAFSFVLMDPSGSIGVRDPHGFRPLCLGRLGPSTARGLGAGLGDAGARRHRRHLRARARARGAGGHRRRRARSSIERALAERGRSHAVHLRVRLLRPARQPALRPGGPRDPAGAWASCWPTRRRSRPTWSWACPTRACPAAEGYARRSGIPYGQGLVKNRYIGRTFIAPDQQDAGRRGAPQAQPAARAIAGKRLVVVDDSIVRGTTTRAIVSRCCARPGPPRCTCASRRRPTAGPASTASTPRTGASCWPPTTRSTRSQKFLSVDSLAYLSLDEPARRPSTRRAPGSATPASPGSTRCPSRWPWPTDGRLEPSAVRSPRSSARPRCPGSEPREIPSARGPAPPMPAPGSTSTAADEAVERLRAVVASTSRPGVLGASVASAACSSWTRPLPPRRCWCRRPTGSGPSWWWPGTPVATTPSASTWWPCASTTWCARAPSRCSSWTTWPSAGSTRHCASSGGRDRRGLPAGRVRHHRRGDGRASRGHGAPATSTWPASPWAWSRPTSAWAARPGACPGDVLVGLASPGLRSNGYTLARRVLLEQAGRRPRRPGLGRRRHHPGRRAAAAVGDLRARRPGRPGGIGRGGARRGPHHRGRDRRQPGPGAAGGHCDAVVDRGSWTVPEDLRRDPRRGPVDDDEMDRVFNLGLGMVLVVAPPRRWTAVLGPAVGTAHGRPGWSRGLGGAHRRHRPRSGSPR